MGIPESSSYESTPLVRYIIMPCTVLLADNSEIIRRALRSTILAHPRIQLVGEARSFGETLRMAEELKPEVVILDMHLPDVHVFSASQFCEKLRAHSRVVGISVYMDEHSEAISKQVGALALLDKANLSETLLPTIFELMMQHNFAAA
jgi:chemotaxis response regulator CheB